MGQWLTNNTWIWNAFAALGITGVIGLIFKNIFNKKENKASLSKTERETGKISVEKYLVELNVAEIIENKVKLIEIKYKDIIFEMQREHFEIKKDWQGRLEKEMKRRIEVEQENEILKNELHLIREKSDDQDRKIDHLTQKVKELEKHNS